jgi:Tfp pilus assembly protein PilO
MAKLSEKQLIAVTLVVTLVPTLGFCYFIYNDYQKLMDVRGEIRAVQADIQRKNSEIEKIPGIERNLNERAAEFLEHVKILPSAEELENFMRNLGDTAAKTDVDHVESIHQAGGRTRPGRGAAKPAFTKHEYSLKFSCGYKQLADFFHELETSERFIHINDFSITAGRGRDDDSGILNVDATVWTFTYTEEVEKDQPFTPTPKPAPGRDTETEETSELETYVQKPNWRDPFRSVLREKVDPDKPVTSRGQTVEPPVDQKVGEIEEQRRQLDSLYRKLRHVQSAYGEKKYSEILQLLDIFEEAWKGRPRFTDEELEAQANEYYASFQDTRKEVMDEQEFITRWAELRLQEIATQFEVAQRSNTPADLERVIETQRAMDDTLARYSVDEQNIDISSLRQQAEEFARRARTRLEFADLPLELLGLIYLFDQESDQESRAVVRYEQETQELDSMENEIRGAPGDLKLKKVEKDGVVFAYKGELILKPLDVEEEDSAMARQGSTRRRTIGPGSRRR